MTFRLKPGQHAIEVVDGPFAGRRYLPEQVYAEIPPGEEHRFERADLAPVVPINANARPARSKARAIEDESA